ncbi:hypothetical protein GCM10025794_25310 [Massilia kyonggiensis]
MTGGAAINNAFPFIRRELSCKQPNSKLEIERWNSSYPTES